jgi:hypothetical protein
MEATAITSINPFPNDVCTAFQAYIQDPHHVNWERIPYSKWQQMHLFINDPTLKPENPVELNLKHRALTEFHLINRRLHRDPDTIHKKPRYVVPESEAFNLIIHKHLQLLHTRRDKVWASI